MAYNQTITTGSLVPRIYSDFRGVDFSNRDVALTRSPDALNMYKDYKNDIGKSIETRPGIVEESTFDNTVFGRFFYDIGNTLHIITHSGTKLYDGKNIIYSQMNPSRSKTFEFNNLLYIIDGLNYLVYNGEKCKEVEGYIPTTSIACKPSGGGTAYEGVNLIGDYRKNTFIGDGESTDYYVDVKDLGGFDVSSIPTVKDLDNNIYLTVGVDFSVIQSDGLIRFNAAPSKPLTDGRPNIEITFKKTNSEYKQRITHCNLVEVFDNRVFFSGNKNYPNTIFNTRAEDPTYISDKWYTRCGNDLSPIKAIVKGNNVLWAFKKPSTANNGVFYLTPTIDYDVDYKLYPSVHSSIAIGCVSDARNFNDDIVFLSNRGLEGIASSDINSEQIIAHRSSLVDAKMLNENGYENSFIEEWRGYLLIIIDNKIYLADSRKQFANENHNEYEWYYWEMEHDITSTCVYNDTLYLCCDNKVYTLTDNEEYREIESYWTTPEDNFKTARFLKTTNKRGCTVDMTGSEIKVATRIDNNDFEEIGSYTNVKDYVVPRIKKKKWRNIQLKVSSNKPFGLFLITLECYVGGYVKR